MKIFRFFLPVFVAVIMCPAIAFAETHYKPHIAIGARGGVSMGQISFSPSVKQLWNMGSTGAVTFRYTEEKIFGLIAELGWVQRGWKENYELNPFSYNRTLTYINLPILTHIYFGSRRFKGFINLGPQVAYLIGDKISADFDYTICRAKLSVEPQIRTTRYAYQQQVRLWHLCVARHGILCAATAFASA